MWVGVPNSGEEVYSRLNADRQIDGQISHFDFIFAVTVLFTWVYLSFSPLLFTSLLITAICKASSDSHFAFFHFYFLGWSSFLSPVQCHEFPSIIHQALCLSDVVP